LAGIATGAAFAYLYARRGGGGGGSFGGGGGLGSFLKQINIPSNLGSKISSNVGGGSSGSGGSTPAKKWARWR